MKVITIINQKGGVGKTTTAKTIGEGIALGGARVLFIDLDPQGNLTKSLGGALSEKSVASVLFDGMDPNDAIQQTPLGDLIPSSPILVSTDKVITGAGSEYRLREALGRIQGYDVAIIDTPPALGTLTVNALTASSGIVVPAQADIFSLDGVDQLQNTVEAVRKYCNHSIQVYGIALTRHNPRTVLGRDVAGEFEKRAGRMGTILFKTAIRECIALREAIALRSSIFTYAPKSTGAQDYLALIAELKERIETKEDN